MTKGLDGRSRDADGTIRKKRSDTEISTLRQTYGEHFAEGHRETEELGDLLADTKQPTLSQYLKKA